VLRAYYESQEEVGNTCAKESNFAEMFKCLGDRDKQQKIRMSNPDTQHCELLEISARACDGCTHNPVHTAQKIKHDVEQDMDTIAWAIQLGEYADLGILPPIAKLSSREAVAARVALAHRQFAMQKRFAKLVGMEVGKIVGELMAATFAKKVTHG
jgi:hypothetical protein